MKSRWKQKLNNELKLNFESSSLKKIKNLENENLSLKEKCEGLINKKIVLTKTIASTKMTKCIHCKFHGHSLNICPIRRKIPYKFIQVWVPKRTRDLMTNSQGPKAIWVPKSKWLSLVGVLKQGAKMLCLNIGRFRHTKWRIGNL